MDATSRVLREGYARFCERLGVRFPRPTRLSPRTWWLASGNNPPNRPRENTKQPKLRGAEYRREAQGPAAVYFGEDERPFRLKPNTDFG